MSDSTFDDIDYGIEIRGVYDGISIWVHKDATVTNRWRGFGGRRESATDEYIALNGFDERVVS